MALSQQDMLKGVDFTGINPATGADHNNLIELAAPVLDSATEGKALVLWTKDSALNTPVVPDAASVSKWKRYLWSRIPHSTASSLVPLLYAWNDDVASIATFLKWRRNESDVSVLQAEVDALDVRVTNAEATANNAATTAANAATQAANAVATANTALATADTAAANSSTALANASTAISAAASAQSTADTALTNANTSLTTATNALNNSSVVAANKFFTSAETTLAFGLMFDSAHGLAAIPKFIRWVLVCKVAEFGYAINDEIDATPLIGSFNDNSHMGFTASASATNIALVKVNNTVRILSKVDGSIQILTEASWKAKCYAWA